MKIQRASGKAPILTLLPLARRNGCRETRLNAEVSGETERASGKRTDTCDVPSPETYTASEKTFLLDLARKTLASIAANGPLPKLAARDVPPKLAEKKACFVTLTERGELRGCIGQLIPQESLCEAVEDNVQCAALYDRRFPPVQLDEVNDIKIEITVLANPEPLPFDSPTDLLKKLRPGEDGVVLRIGSRSATYLPQVWEQVPDKEEFLNQLSAKAGCNPSAWRGKNTSVFTYHAEAFREPD